MEKEEKQAVVDEVKAKLADAASTVLTDYRGLTVHDLAELRGKLAQEGVEYKIYKNTLIKRAISDSDFAALNDLLVGPTALAFGFGDPISAARLLSDFAKTNKSLKLKGGILEDKVLDLQAIKSLAALPSREVLLSKLVGMMQAPVSGLANVLSAPVRGLAAALNQVASEKE